MYVYINIYIYIYINIYIHTYRADETVDDSAGGEIGVASYNGNDAG